MIDTTIVPKFGPAINYQNLIDLLPGMERRLGGQLNAVDTPPTGPPGVGEER